MSHIIRFVSMICVGVAVSEGYHDFKDRNFGMLTLRLLTIAILITV